MLAKKRMLALILTLPVIAVVAYFYISGAPGYTPADNAKAVAQAMQANLQGQQQILQKNEQTSHQLATAITTLNQQITEMQSNYQKHLLSLAQRGLINLNN